MPDTASIQRASASSLRLVIPTDVYASSIEVHISGVRAEVKLGDASSQVAQQHEKPPHDEAPLSPSEKTEDVVIPSPEDLAKSFLQQEPTQETAQLEAELTSQSVDLQQSAASSEPEDDGAGYGTGGHDVLPGFLAGFFAGIADRLRISIRDVEVLIHMRIKQPLPPNENPPPDDVSSIPIALIYSMDSVDVEGVTTSNDAHSQSPYGKGDSAVGKRSVSLHGLKVYLRCKRATLNRFTALQESMRSRTSPPSNASHHGQPGVAVQGEQDNNEDRFGSRSEAPSVSTDLMNFPFVHEDIMEESRASFASFGSDYVRRGGGDEEEDSMLEAREPFDADNLPSPTSIHSRDGLHSTLQSFRAERLPLDRRRLRRAETPSAGSTRSDSRPETPPTPATAGITRPGTSVYMDTADTSNAPMTLNESTVTASTPQNELTESKLFSHDEAASLYMSVLDTEKVEDPQVHRMPGAWDEQSHPTMGSHGSAHLPTSSQDRSAHAEVLGQLHSRRPLGQSSTVVDGAKRVDSMPEDRSRNSCGGIDLAAGGDIFTKRTLVEVKAVHLHLPSLVSSTTAMPDAERDLASTTQKGIPTTQGGEVTAESAKMNPPGSFSTHVESAHITGSQSNGINAPQPAAQQADRSDNSQQVSMNVNVSVERLSVSCSFDELPLLNSVLKEFQSQAAATSSLSKPANVSRSNTTSRQMNACIRLEDSTIMIINGEDVSQEGNDQKARSTDDSENLLGLRLFDLRLDLTKMDELISQADVGVRRVEIDVGGQKVVRFDQDARMQSSVRDTQVLSGRDLSLRYKRLDSGAELSLTTLPMAIEVNATQLDETLNSIGGFSALLEMGSSIISDVTAENANRPTTSPRPRVHFDQTPPVDALRESTAAGPKINVRVNGLSTMLQAGDLAVRYNSTAIKAIMRKGCIGVQIDDSRLTGPFRATSKSSPKSSIRARNLHVRYLGRPEEQDLTRLITLVTPSKDNFERGDGGVMVDTLVRQRKNGAAARISLSELTIDVNDTSVLDELQSFASDLSRLGAITKYLPEETRPGLLMLASIDTINARTNSAPILGDVAFVLSKLELANVTAPSLLAFGVTKIDLKRKKHQRLVHPALPSNLSEHSVMLMARLVGEEPVPVFEVKLMNVCIEYEVSVLMEMLGIQDSPHGVDALASSIAHVSPKTHNAPSTTPHKHMPEAQTGSGSSMTSFKIDLGVRNCSIGLTPRRLPSKALFVLTNTRVQFEQGRLDVSSTNLELRKATILLIDDRKALHDFAYQTPEPSLKAGQHIPYLCRQGYVTVCWVSAAHASIAIEFTFDGNLVDVEFDDQLLVLESCSDSTNTLTELLAALQPPPTPSSEAKYQTEVTTVEDMMASFVGEPVSLQRKGVAPKRQLSPSDLDSLDDDSTDTFNALDDEGFPRTQHTVSHDSSLSDLTSGLALDTGKPESGFETTREGLSLTSLPEQAHATASKWDSDRNRYIPVSQSEVLVSPFKLQVKNMHIIWNLHDGYDWPKTREVISKAVQELELKSEEKRKRDRQRYERDDEPEPVVGDFLFNSIYVGIPFDQDPRDVTCQINRNLDDLISETESHATTTTDATPRPYRSPRLRPKTLKLERSQRHKIAFELSGVSANMFIYPPGQETVSSTDIRVQDFDIFDHVPTSTWKKFMTYMRDAGPREDKKPMMHIEVCNVKPIPNLLASELVMRVTVLPVRLHVDQDALDFMTRFFAFNNDATKDEPRPGDQPYIQRVEVLPVPLKLDYKPKKVDYVGLRSGRTKEFMNFFNLDGADMVLKHAIIYGCSSFARLHSSLEDIWMPDITTKQLPTVLSGLNGVRTLVNVGTGMRNLVTVPIAEYKKDGRIVRSISKGALSFARTSGSAATKFGAKLAVGAQNYLQGAEDFLVQRDSNDVDWEVTDLDEEEKRAISHYAEQPAGILQGLKGAAKSLEHDLLVTRDVIVAVSGEARESGSAEGAVRAVVRSAPTIVLRPMIGASKALGQTLMGATNTVDPAERRRVEDVSPHDRRVNVWAFTDFSAEIQTILT